MGLTTGWEPDLPHEDSLLRRFVYSFADRSQFVAIALGGRHQRTDLADFADPDSAFVFDNAVTLLRPVDDREVAAIVEEASEFFPPQRTWVLFSVWPLPDLTAAGLELVGHPPFMLRPPGPAPTVSGGLRIVEVETAEQVAEFDRVLTEGYPMPGGGAVADARLLGGPIRLFVGYEGARPVAVSGAGISHGLVDVEWVAVLPECRGKGYGKAMTVHAMTAEPDLPAVLLSSDDGRPVYERLGFLPVLRCTIWWRPTLSP